MTDTASQLCNCQALRQAARRISQFYDSALAPLGIRTSQYSILSHVAHIGPVSINALASRLVMDRTTMGRNVRPLQRDGLLAITTDPSDRRARALALTDKGRALLDEAQPIWAAAQRQFEDAFGPDRAASLRRELRDVVGVEG